ncbi:MAG: Cobalt-zinc-cadmium resistance protein CzcB [bacterium ADurb.Bin236]|nr:MAG: Cobalt-zinc-cadmium resistance protein CzcB [bacterium ADurb.Bin236]HPN93416.1 efflux RND transporter periplasmic adaptor subunit [bacterium]
MDGIKKRKAGIMAVAAICLTIASGCSDRKADNAGPGAAAREAVSVETAPVVVRAFEEVVRSQGSLSAKNSANVSARIPGTLVAVYVSEGDAVTAGRTKLFEVDSIKLRNAVEIGRQDRAVAEQGVRAAEAGLEQVNAQLLKMEKDLKRIAGLYDKDVVSKDSLEKAQSGHDQLAAAKKQAESAVSLARERQKQAEIALNISQKDLSDTLIYAPISGRVAMRFAEAGEMAAPGYPIVRIEDTSVLEASAFLPAQWFARVKESETKVRLEIPGVEFEPKTITYKSPTINPKLRTFEVKAVVTNPPEGVAPGAMAGLAVVLGTRESIAVPSDSVRELRGGNVVFIIRDGKAEMIEVKTGLESDGFIEILEGALSESDLVAVRGQRFLDDGTPVSVRREAE